MKNKKCDHTSFWKIYKVINFHRTFFSEKGSEFKCKKCHKKYVLIWKGYNKIYKHPFKRFSIYLLWLLPAITLMFLVINRSLNFLVAIGLIIAFHFFAMYFIINSPNLKISEK